MNYQNSEETDVELLKRRILSDGWVLPGGVLKVDGFLNHQLDPDLLRQMGKEFARRFKKEEITKILTIESSGIALAVPTGEELGVPVLFAKKAKTSNLGDDVYTAGVYSFTHRCNNQIFVSKMYLSERDRVLIIDDFLATGSAIRGLMDLCAAAGAIVVGAGAAIEKRFQDGGDALRASGLHIESLAIIESMSEDGEIIFGE